MTSDIWLGSQLAVSPVALREHIERLQGEVGQAFQLADEYEALFLGHNYFTAYTVLMLLHGTGHRPARDPFCHPWHVGNGFALVTDKVSSPNHQFRLSVLPDLAMEQLVRYRSHLRALTALMARKPGWEQLGRAIASSLRWPREVPGLPQFFFLDDSGSYSAAPATLAPWLGSWPWPLNLGRKLVWQGLRDRGVRPEWVRLQVGHAGWGETPWGSDSLYSPSAFLSIGSELDAILAEQGWAVVEGLPGHSDAKNASPQEPPGAFGHRPAILGPYARAKERDRKAAQYRDAIRRIIRGVAEPQGKGGNSIGPEQARTIHRKVVADFPGRPDIKDRAANLVRRWLQIRHGVGQGIPRRRSVEPPAFPFSEDWLEQLEQARGWRTAFLEYLATQKGPDTAKDSPQASGSQRLAEIVTSAALLGGLATKDRLATLPKAITTSTWRLDKALLVDAPEAAGHADQPSWRWMPDPVSSGLIASWCEAWGAKEPPTNTLKADLRQLLNRLGGDLQGKSDPFSVLAEWARPLAEFQVPGLFRPYWVEGKGGAPLPRATWNRLSANKRLPWRDQDQGRETASEGNESGKISLPSPQTHQSHPSARAFLRAFHGVVREAENTEAQRGRNRDRQQMRVLAGEVRALFPQGHPNPSVALAMGEWAIHLTRAGTRHQKELKFSTVATYLRQVAAPLVATAWGLDFLQTEPEDREALFEEALAYPSTEDEQARLGRRFQEFHAFLEDQHGLEPLDWGFLPFPPSDNQAEAQLLTPAEYRKALTLLREGAGDAAGGDVSEAELTPGRVLPAVALVLGYRYGLRSGEVFRLRGRDLQFSPGRDVVVVHVVANPYGTPKSRAGRRSVPNVEELEDQELATLEAGSRVASQLDETGRGEVGIFADPDNPSRLRGRGPILNQVQSAMRKVSGAPDLRFHHLRHGFGNRLFLGLVADEWPGVEGWPGIESLMADLNPGAATREFLTGHRALNEDTLVAYAQALGHASPATSARHYLHVMEPLIQGAMGQQFTQHLSGRSWCYILWKSDGVLKKRQQSKRPPGLPYARGWLDAIAPLHIAGRPGAIGKLPAPWEEDPSPTLEGIDELLLANLEMGGEVERAAKRVGYSVECARTLLGIAIDVAEQSWFDALIPPPKGAHPRSLSPLRSASRKVREGLKQWDQRLPNLDRSELAEGLKLWMLGHQKSTGLIWLVRHAEFADFFRFASGLEFVAELEVRPAPAFQGVELPESLQQLFEECCVPLGDPASARPPDGRFVDPEWVGGVGIKPKGRWSYTNRLHRGLFCLAIWARFLEKANV